MGDVKRKSSNAGKIAVARFEEVQEEFLADIKAEVLMNEVHPELILIGTKQQSSLSLQGSEACIVLRRRSSQLLVRMINDKLWLF